MIRSYLKIAWRSLLLCRFYSLLNIIGLAVGITFTALIGAYVWAEYQITMLRSSASYKATGPITTGVCPSRPWPPSARR